MKFLQDSFVETFIWVGVSVFLYFMLMRGVAWIIFVAYLVQVRAQHGLL